MSCENCQTCISDAITIQPKNAVFNVTDACNFRCPYCFVEHNPRRATLEIAEKVCQYLLNAPGEGRPTLWFFGGEPMLEFNTIIKPIVEKYTDQMTFGITTNGSLLNEDVVDFFYKHKVSILLSIDGVAEVQNVQRPFADGRPSFEAVCRNIPYLLLKYPETHFRATLTKHSIPYMNETYDFARHMGFKHITFVVNEFEDYDDNDQLELERQYDLIALKILDGSPLWLEDISKAKEYNTQHESTVFRCGYGTTSIGVTVEGKITPCQELSSFDGAVIGDVFNGIDKTLHEAFLQKATKELKMPEGLDPQMKTFILNGVCPKREYANNDFTVTKGREMQLRAMRHLYNHFHRVTRRSGNKYWQVISQ